MANLFHFRFDLEELRRRWLLLATSVVAIAVFALIELAGSTAVDWFEFRRQDIASGDLWRLYTSQFVHFGLYHAVMNAAGLLFMVVALYWFLPSIWLVIGVTLIPLMVGLGMYILAPDVEFYRGFSGVNYGMLAMGLLLAVPQQRWLYGFAYLVVLGKILYEQQPGYDVDYLREEIGVAVAIEAHLAGFCAGSLLGFVGLIRQGFIKAS